MLCANDKGVVRGSGVKALANTFPRINAALLILWLPDGTLVAYRQAAALGAVFVLVYGFMWELD